MFRPLKPDSFAASCIMLRKRKLLAASFHIAVLSKRNNAKCEVVSARHKSSYSKSPPFAVHPIILIFLTKTEKIQEVSFIAATTTTTTRTTTTTSAATTTTTVMPH